MGKIKLLVGCWALLVLSGEVKADNGCEEFGLSESLCAMVDSGRVDFLEQVSGRCRGLLFEQADEIALRVKFYFDQAQVDAVERFEGLLSRCETDLKLLEKSMAQLEAFMEWTPVAKWDHRFGRNGFYHQVMRVKREAQVLRAVQHYYVAWVGASIGRETNGLVNELQKAVALLDDKRELQLWSLKVMLLLVKLEALPLDRIEPKIEVLLKQPLNGEQLWSLRLLVLEHTNLLAAGEAGKVKVQIEKTRQWLTAQEGSMQKQLVLSLYEGCFEKERLQETGDINMTLNEQLAPLKRLMVNVPRLRGAAELWVGEQVAALFFKSRTQRKWDAFELMSLRRYYQEQEPVDFDSIRAVCDIFLTNVSPDDVGYPEMLYQKGLVHFQKKEKIPACYAWERLVREFPDWSYSSDVSAIKAGAMAGSMAYNLFVADPDTHGALAKQVLGTLSQNDRLNEYRYHYGLVLVAEKDYRAAAVMFQLASKQYENYGKACVELTRCYLKIFPKETQPKELIRVMAELVATIDKKGNDRDLFDVVLTLAGLRMNGTAEDHQAVLDLLDDFGSYWKGLAKNDATYVTVIFVRAVVLQKLGQYKNSLRELRPALQANQKEQKFWNVGLSLLDSCREPFRELHRRGQHAELLASLEEPLAVAALFYEQLGQGDNVWQAKRVRRDYLEQLALWLLVSANDEVKKATRLKIAHEIVDVSVAQEEIVPQLWLVRCQALLAFGQGDFKESQLLWYRIRQNSSLKALSLRDAWLEARYYGLVCLYEQEGTESVKRLIEQVLEQYSWIESEWIERLKSFQEGL